MEITEAIELLKQKNYVDAVNAFKTLAEQGNADGCDFLVQMYFLNLTNILTKEDVLHYAIKGYELRSKDSCYNMGTIYRNGFLGEPDYEKSYEFFLEGADSFNDARCQYYVGEILLNGELGTIKADEAISFYNKSAQQSFYPAQFSLAKIFENTVKNFDVTLDFYLHSAENGHIDAILRLAYLYEKGLRVEKDFNKSFEYYSSAADKGSYEAILKLVEFSIDKKVKNALSKSVMIKKLEKLINDCNDKNIKSKAFLYLGNIQELQGASQEIKAFKNFFEASKCGSMDGLYKYAQYLYNGKGCPQNVIEGFALMHVVRYVSLSGAQIEKNHQTIIDQHKLAELSERLLVDWENDLSIEDREKALKIADDRIGKMFGVTDK